MGLKEKLQKELDLILEKMRFWRYIIVGIVSGTIGVIFSMSQNKIDFNFVVLFFLLLAVIGMIVSVKRIEFLTRDYYKLLDRLEKEK